MSGKLTTGIAGVDEMLSGGLPEGRVYIINGPPGAGKTTFAVQFLVNGALKGEKCLYISLMEDPRNIISDMTNYPSFNILMLTKAKRIMFIDMGPKLDDKFGFTYGGEEKEIIKSAISKKFREKIEEEELQPPTSVIVANKIKEIVEKEGIKRLVIDSFASIKFSSDDEKAERRDTVRFVRQLKTLGCTTIILSEMTEPNEYTIEQFAAHGVMFIHHFLNKGKMVRGFQIIKLRGVKVDTDIFEMGITSNGIDVSRRKLTTV